MFKEIEFHIGDKVVNIFGDEGIIENICDCDQCKDRGFLEPKIRYANGDFEYITNYVYKNGLENYYIIGNNKFKEHLNIENIQSEINDTKKAIKLSTIKLNQLCKLIEVLGNQEKEESKNEQS